MSEFDDFNNTDDLFRTFRVRELDNEDFILNSEARIALRSKGCSAVLFYNPRNDTSKGLKVIWNELSETLAGVNFFSVNTSRRTDIMRAFSEVRQQLNHPLNHLHIL